MINYFERLFFAPKRVDFIVAYLLLPFSFIYGLIGYIRYLFAKPKDYGIKIISIGNLLIGGSGKTPFAITLINYLSSKKYSDIYYISRGYGRESRGLVVVKIDSKIVCNPHQSGDEAMLVAEECNCSVIVSEDRVKAIELAKAKGAKIVILDDAFSKVNIKKFDILLEPKELPNRFVLPSGPFREFKFAKKRANLILKEDIDFKRLVEFENLTDKMLLVTAIANPKRLNKFLPSDVVDKYYLKDHAYFEEDKILKIVDKIGAKSILVTQKDYVKMEHFKLPISIIKLKLDINSKVLEQIESYLKG